MDCGNQRHYATGAAPGDAGHGKAVHSCAAAPETPGLHPTGIHQSSTPLSSPRSLLRHRQASA